MAMSYPGGLGGLQMPPGDEESYRNMGGKMPYVFDWIYTGREGVQHGPAGVAVTNTLTGNKARSTAYDKQIQNMQAALEDLEALDNPQAKTVKFKYYLHESDHFSGLEWALQRVGVKLTEDLYEKIGKPFYEVILECELDLETGEVKLLDAKL